MLTEPKDIFTVYDYNTELKDQLPNKLLVIIDKCVIQVVKPADNNHDNYKKY